MAVLQAEQDRLHAKLWLTLYLLKKFGITKLKLDEKLKEQAPNYKD